MFCCTNCFQDRYLIHSIKEYGFIGDCNYCLSKNIHIIQTDDLAENFSTFFTYYEKLEHSINYIHGEQEPWDVGEPLFNLIQDEWNVFSEHAGIEIAENLFVDIMYYVKEDFDFEELYAKVFDSFIYEHQKSIWEEFSDDLKKRNRFFPVNSYITDNFRKLFRFNEQLIYEGTIFYRARLNKQTINDMGAPPPSYASPGRANPKGISYLYCSPDATTCIAEIRPYKSAEVTIVKLLAVKPLKLVRLNTKRPVYSAFQFLPSLLEGVETLQLYNTLATDLSFPVRPELSDIEYLPTQYLSEFIKNEGYDGFIYASSQTTLDNYVIFDERNVVKESIEYKKIEMINYRYTSVL